MQIYHSNAPSQALAGMVVHVAHLQKGAGAWSVRVEIHADVIAADFRYGLAVVTVIALRRRREGFWALRTAAVLVERKKLSR